MDMITDLGRFIPPVSAEDFGLENLFGSNPDYDEASGPPRDDHYYLVDEFADDEGWSEEEEEQERARLYFQDPYEPLGPGETEASVRASLAQSITVDPDHEFNCGPAKTAIRLFNDADTLPAVDELVIMPITVFNPKSMHDKKCKRWMSILSAVNVSVRTKRH